MDKADIPFLSATELSRLIEKREVSPVEATEAYLERIDDLDFKFNAYLNNVCRTEALQAASEAEQAIAQGNYIGPMHGVPVAVKDQFWSKGIRSTGGSRILADFIPEEDSTVIANLKKAGAILLAGQNEPHRVRHNGLLSPLQHSSQSLEPGYVHRRVQQRLRGCHCCLPMRHLPGRGYRGIYTVPGNLVRPGGSKAQLGQSKPLRGHAWRLVYGHRWTYI